MLSSWPLTPRADWRHPDGAPRSPAEERGSRGQGGAPYVPRYAARQLSISFSRRSVAKCEFFNTGGSIKDRIGWRMVEDAEKSGYVSSEQSDVLCAGYRRRNPLRAFLLVNLSPLSIVPFSDHMHLCVPNGRLYSGHFTPSHFHPLTPPSAASRRETPSSSPPPVTPVSASPSPRPSRATAASSPSRRKCRRRRCACVCVSTPSHMTHLSC